MVLYSYALGSVLTVPVADIFRQVADLNKNLQTEAGGGGGAAGVLSEVTEDMESLGAGDIPTVIALVNRAAEQFNQRSEEDDILEASCN